MSTLPQLGHALIDRQHHQLELLSRDLLRLARRGQPCRPGLTAYLRTVRRHFASEERLMLNHGYPELEGHRALHDGVVAEVLRFRAELAAGAPLHPHHAEAIAAWLEHHASEADRNLVTFLNGPRR